MTTITIKLGERTIELTADEAKQVLAELKSVFGKKEPTAVLNQLQEIRKEIRDLPTPSPVYPVLPNVPHYERPSQPYWPHYPDITCVSDILFEPMRFHVIQMT